MNDRPTFAEIVSKAGWIRDEVELRSLLAGMTEKGYIRAVRRGELLATRYALTEKGAEARRGAA